MPGVRQGSSPEPTAMVFPSSLMVAAKPNPSLVSPLEPLMYACWLCAGRRTGPHKGPSVNQARENSVHRSYRLRQSHRRMARSLSMRIWFA